MNRLTVHLFIPALLLLALAGCDNDRPMPTATSPSDRSGARGAVATFTATARPPDPPTPTPTWTPFVTPAPVSRLEQAAYLHEIGDYTEEEWMLLALLADPGASLAQQQEARYRLGLAYLADDQPAQALDTLEKFQLEAISLPPEDSRRVNSLFLRAEALAGLGRTAEAVAAYSAFLEQNPQVIGPVEEMIADTWLAAGERARAADALRRAADQPLDNGEKARLLERLASVYEADERWADAAFVYDEILSFSVRPAYRVGILRRAGDAYAAADEEEAAIGRWRLALAEAPDSNAAYQALIQLVNRDEPVDLFLRGEIDLFAEAYLPAIRAYEGLLAASPDDPRAGEAWLGIGKSYLGLGQWNQASLALDRALRDYPNCPCFGEVWLTRARLEIARGTPPAGRRIYRTFARDYPDDPLAAEALWRSALSAIAADNQLEAAADLLALVDGFPDSERAADGLSVLGIGAFTNRFYDQAAGSFARLLADYPDVRPGAAGYWLGRSLHAQGETEQARSQWQTLTEREPDTYYGLLAGLALAGHDEPGQNLFRRVDAIAAEETTLDGDDGSEAFAAQWVAGWTGAGVDALAALSEPVATDPDLIGGALLLALDRRAEGVRLLEQAYRRHRDDPAALYPLVLHLEALGANRLAIGAAEHLVFLSPARRMAAAPIFLQRIAYPRHYSRLVEAEAPAFGIDPLLFYSLIRQESLFEPGARSFAAAQGLAQIIPSTGEEIAGRLSYPNYRNELLYRPFVNVRFGAFYLRWVRDFANDSTAAALAGYNAGPGNARNWLNRTTPDEALFVELIPLSEPRLYVQRILTHYYHYLQLYGTDE